MSNKTTTGLLSLAATIVAAHIAKNQLGAGSLPSLITTVYNSLATAADIAAGSEAQASAVAWKKSVFPDYIICLENGKKLKMLKKHLNKNYGLTPEGYREKWKLPADYPMVAPNYSKRRSALAKMIGLGVRRNQAAGAVVRTLPARQPKRSKG